MRASRWMAVALLASGCHQQAIDNGATPAVPLVANAPESDEVVATVEGRPIRVSDIQAQARAAGTDAKQTLQDLITAEVLAGEAARRRLVRDPEVTEAARSKAVRRLLGDDFEGPITPLSIPENSLKKTYKSNINMFEHSEYVDVWHILVPVADKASPEDRKAARAVAEEVARRAKGVPSVDAFKAIATQVAPPPAAGEFKVERIVTARDGWVLTTFSYAAFELKSPGDTSGVVETTYGYHVIYLTQRIPAIHKPLEEAEVQLRKMMFPRFQKEEFLRFTAEVAKKHQVVVHPEKLGAEVPSP